MFLKYHYFKHFWLLSLIYFVFQLFFTLIIGNELLARENFNLFQKDWQKEMKSFSQEDLKHPPLLGGIVFVGSSTIRHWNLKKSFPQITPPPINRGFGGSIINDTIEYFDQLILKYKPRLIVFYGGDNDLKRGKSPENVAKDFEKLSVLIQEKLPQAKLIYISIKPSKARWGLAEKAKKTNSLIKAKILTQKNAIFLDVWTPMLNDQGKPRKELFKDDDLHINENGYRQWSSLLLPFLRDCEVII